MAEHLDHDWFPKTLPGNVVLGPRSWLYSSFAFLHYQSCQPAGVRVGHDTGLYNGTFFDLGPDASVEIGNYCSLVGAVIATNGHVRIGDYSFIAHEVVIADCFDAVPGPTAPAQRSILIGDNVWIGANAVILAGAKIGEGAIIGAAARVDFEVPPYTIVAGNPAAIRRKIQR